MVAVAAFPPFRQLNGQAQARLQPQVRQSKRPCHARIAAYVIGVFAQRRIGR